MANLDRDGLARELLLARTQRMEIGVPPSARGAGFDLDDAYAVEAEIARLRVESGRKIVGRKVGYANKAMWRILKLETLVWAHMYDDTVLFAEGGSAELPRSAFRAPRIEPEIVFKLKLPMAVGGLEAPAALEAVEWVAAGFEIIDCPYPGWQFQPVDFVAAYGLHAALVVGEPKPVETAWVPALTDELGRFKLRLLKNGELVEEGAGKNALRSPALCLAELAGAASRRSGPLRAGELISTGTLTNAQAVESGETWRVEIDGLAVANVMVRID
jgi:2-oxo-3-hexenedioate decarboxylase